MARPPAVVKIAQELDKSVRSVVVSLKNFTPYRLELTSAEILHGQVTLFIDVNYVILI